MIRCFLLAATCAALFSAMTAHAQITAPGSGPVDISAADFELVEERDMIVYTGDVNAVRGDARLRADRLEAYFGFGANGRREIHRIVAAGDVFYITANEIARGNAGEYDLLGDSITLTGDVVLTQGCNVSTGESLSVDLGSGFARLRSGTNNRVRSVFFTNDNGAEAVNTGDCPSPDIPGAGPRAFEDGSAGGAR